MKQKRRQSLAAFFSAKMERLRRRSMKELFEHTSIRRAYFTLSLPVVLSMVVTLVYNLVDTFFVSRTQNPNLVAGVSQGAPIFTLLIAIGDVFGLGGSSVISRLFGEQENEKGRCVSAYCFYAPILTGIIVAILMFCLQTPFLHLLGASSATWKYARQYYLVIAVGAPAIIFYFSPVNILRTEGLAFQSMEASIIGTVVNIILNPFFIFTCGLGAAGSALATVIANVLSDILMIHVLRTKSQHLSTSIHEIKISRHLQSEIYAIGIPASITNLMATFAVALTNDFLIKYGAASVAAMGISLKLSMVANMIFSGFAFGAQPLIGYTYGAKDFKRYYQAFKLELKVICGIALVATIIMFAIVPIVIRGFMKDPTVIREGTVMIRWLVSSSVLAGVILALTTVFQSMGKALPAFILSFCRQGLIFAICMVVLSQIFGYTGILAAQACSDLLTTILAIALFIHYRPSRQ